MAIPTDGPGGASGATEGEITEATEAMQEFAESAWGVTSDVAITKFCYAFYAPSGGGDVDLDWSDDSSYGEGFSIGEVGLAKEYWADPATGATVTIYYTITNAAGAPPTFEYISATAWLDGNTSRGYYVAPEISWSFEETEASLLMFKVNQASTQQSSGLKTDDNFTSGPQNLIDSSNDTWLTSMLNLGQGAESTDNTILTSRFPELIETNFGPALGDTTVDISIGGLDTDVDYAEVS